MKTPSIAQMRARMTGGHRRILEALRDGKGVPVATAAEARGLQTCRATLIGWGCMESGQITDTGRRLLTDYYDHNGGASKP